FPLAGAWLRIDSDANLSLKLAERLLHSDEVVILLVDFRLKDSDKCLQLCRVGIFAGRSLQADRSFFASFAFFSAFTLVTLLWFGAFQLLNDLFDLPNPFLDVVDGVQNTSVRPRPPGYRLARPVVLVARWRGKVLLARLWARGQARLALLRHQNRVQGTENR